MSDQQLRKEAHDLDVTVWVGKHGIDSVIDETADQLADAKLVKVKFLRAAGAEPRPTSSPRNSPTPSMPT